MNCNDLRKDFNLIDKVGEYSQSNTGNFEKDRKTIKDNIVDLFKLEKAGKGTGKDSTRTIYCMESINGEVVYLKRPATLNNGFDFEIHAKIHQFGGRIKSRPRHEDILDLLRKIKISSLSDFKLMQSAIDLIYECNDPDDMLKSSKHSILRSNSINGIKHETILKLIKWLFIEQDITYWHFSGRTMFYGKLKNV